MEGRKQRRTAGEFHFLAAQRERYGSRTCYIAPVVHRTDGGIMATSPQGNAQVTERASVKPWRLTPTDLARFARRYSRHYVHDRHEWPGANVQGVSGRVR
jgi:hypothetical protein